MNIVDATRKAMQEGKQITRSHEPRGITLIPTNTPECYICCADNGNDLAPRWSPSADDILSDDWRVVG